MTLPDFQRALCDLIASPRLCTALRADPPSVLAAYTLSPKERRRLLDAVWQRGMSTNCSLYRSNRITPIYTLLRSTCTLLGERLPALVDRFWEAKEFSNGQFLSEVEKFARFLKHLIRTGEMDDAMLEEVLDFEIAANELLFSPRRQMLAALSDHTPTGPDTLCQLHPLARIVRFRHDPAALLGALASESQPDPGIVSGDFYVALTILNPQLEIVPIGPSLGRIMATAGPEAPALVTARSAPELRDAGLLVPYAQASSESGRAERGPRPAAADRPGA